MKISDLLVEVADQPYRYLLTKRTPAGNQYMFKTDAGISYTVSLAREPLSDGGNRAEVAFAERSDSDQSGMEITGRGDAFKVFATVAAITRDYLATSKEPIRELMFRGKTKDPTRIKLYDRIARSLNRFLPDFRFKGEGSDGVDKVYYFERASDRELAETKISLVENRGHPVICVDVQPEYSGMMDGDDEDPVFPEIIEFVALKQTGPVLMFVNAEDQGLTGDTVSGIKQYWEDTVSYLRGELDEIAHIELSPDSFPIDHVKSLLDNAEPTEHLIDELRLYEIRSGVTIGLILADESKTPAAFAGFISRKGDKIWEVANAKTYGPHAGKALVAKLYKLAKDTYGKSIQSDIEQTDDAKRKWTKTLPAMGLNPMIYDTKTGYIINPKTTGIDVYDRSQPHRYAWIIERNDRYRDSDLLREGQLQILMPLRGLWHDGGISGDERKMFNEALSVPINWNRFTIVDKGYGYMRSWMDAGITPAVIIRVIRALYQAKVSDSRELFGGEESDTYEPGLRQLVGAEFEDWMLSDPIIVNWTSVAQLKRFNGAYIVGGGRNECLREVELLMNAFNIKYKRIDSLVYG